MPLDVEALTRRLIEFRDARNWARFHNPKDLAMGLSVEAAELLEVFLWRPHEEAERARVEEELADVFVFVLLLAEKYGIDLERIVRCADLLRSSGVKHTFRTTVVPGLVGKDDVVKIGEWLNGAAHYVVQQFVPQTTIDPAYLDVKPFGRAELEEIVAAARPYFGEVGIEAP